MRKWILVGAVMSLVASTSAYAETFRAVYVAEVGKRVDYFPQKKSFASQDDPVSEYRFEIVVPEQGDRAKIRLVPIGKNTDPTEDYPAMVLSRSPDMIVLLAILKAADKFETYTLYPKLGVGYTVVTSSFLGSETLKAQASFNSKIPWASGRVNPLRRIDK